jgi:MYXO-CTERM domain-containing protein
VLDTQTFTGGAPAISYIGIYANADTLATGSRITNLELSSVPEPSGGVIALGAAGIFLVRRRRIS